MNEILKLLMTRIGDGKDYCYGDFVYGFSSYTKGFQNTRVVDSHHLAQAEYLVNETLAPLTEKYGIPSISNGMSVGVNGPHNWIASEGAALDAWFMNGGTSPIDILRGMRSDKIAFDRVITYAGSGYMCISNRKAGNRSKMYENRYDSTQPNSKPYFLDFNKSRKDLSLLDSSQRYYKDEWLRGMDEPIYHTQRKLRPAHIRVSKYFSMLDMFMSYKAVEGGYNNVMDIPSLTRDCGETLFHKHAYVFGAALDEIYDTTGNKPCVIRGCNKLDIEQFHWDNEKRPSKLGFTISSDAVLPETLLSGAVRVKHYFTHDGGDVYILTNNKPVTGITLRKYHGYRQE